ncbi:MAG: Ig-like domain-containing protein [Bdellovibrionota bacterium]
MKRIAGALVALALFSGCPLGTNTGNGADRPAVSVRLVDAESGLALGLEKARPVTVYLEGPDRDWFTDLSGRGPRSVTSGGAAVFVLAEERTPTPENPVRVTVVARAEGFLPTSVPAVLTGSGTREAVLRLVEISNPPEGIETAYFDTARTSFEGALANPLRVDTPPEEATRAAAALDISSGTILLDSQALPLDGALSVSVTYLTNQSEKALAAFPGGFAEAPLQHEGVEPFSNGAFLSAGFLAIGVADRFGNRAAEFRDAGGAPAQAQLGVQVPGETMNPETGGPIAAGDSIPLWSYEPETGEWAYESDALLSGPDEQGNFLAQVRIPRPSYWNLAWRLESCTAAAVNLLRAPQTQGLELDLRVRPLSGGSYVEERRIGADESGPLALHAPKSLPLRFEVLYLGEIIGAVDAVLDDSCGPVELSVDFAVPALVDIPLELEGNCYPGPDPFEVPAFRYELWKKPEGLLAAHGAFASGEPRVVHGVPVGTYDVLFWPLGPYLTPFPLTVRGVAAGGAPEAVTQTYQLNCETGEPANVAVLSFKSTPPEVFQGAPVTLSWETKYAAACTLDGEAVPPSGSTEKTPLHTHDYELRCTGQGPGALALARAQVVEPVAIVSFEAPVLAASGEPALLRWEAAHATTCSINGLGAVPAVGEGEVIPLETTTYTLTCQGGAGPASALRKVVTDHRPVALAPAMEGAFEDFPLSVLLTGTDEEDLDPLPLSVTEFPSHGSLDVISGSAPLLVTYTPDADFYGPESFAFTVTDSVSLVSHPVTVSFLVQGVNDLPVVTPVPYTQAVAGVPVQAVLTGTDVEDPVSSLTARVTNGPFAGSVSVSEGPAPLSLAYTPQAGFSGIDGFYFTVTDSEGGAAVPLLALFYVSPSDPSNRLVFASSQQSISAGSCSARTLVQVRDLEGNPVPVSSAVTVTLTGPPSFRFYGDPACSSSLTQVAIPKNASSTGFYFRGTLSGSFVISANDKALVLPPTSQIETILPAEPTWLAFGTPPAATQTAGELWAPFAVQLFDTYGNLASSATDPVTVSLRSGTGTLNGTQTVFAENGTALFTDLSYDQSEDILLDFTSGALEGLLEIPVTVEPVGEAQLVSAGASHTCGIWSGRLYCWGNNGYGQLGDGTQTERPTPSPVGMEDRWSSLSVGDRHTCAIRAGALYCWGENTWGQLGDGTTETRYVPTRVGAGADWSLVATGPDLFQRTCGIRGGALYCWGYNGSGILGVDDTVQEFFPSPVRIGTASGWSSVTLGMYHACGIQGGALYCWGDGGFGKLGLGDTPPPAHAPVQVGTDITWAHVAAGLDHTCGIGGGALYCWGRNWSGALGDGTGANQSAPVRIGLEADWSWVDGGMAHTCGLRAGDLFCWGNNQASQLGDGTFKEKSEPVAIDLAGDWTQVSAGESHTCGVKDRDIYCWGSNLANQLGTGGGDEMQPALVPPPSP